MIKKWITPRYAYMMIIVIKVKKSAFLHLCTIFKQTIDRFLETYST